MREERLRRPAWTQKARGALRILDCCVHRWRLAPTSSSRSCSTGWRSLCRQAHYACRLPVHAAAAMHGCMGAVSSDRGLPLQWLQSRLARLTPPPTLRAVCQGLPERGHHLPHPARRHAHHDLRRLHAHDCLLQGEEAACWPALWRAALSTALARDGCKGPWSEHLARHLIAVPSPSARRTSPSTCPTRSKRSRTTTRRSRCALRGLASVLPCSMALVLHLCCAAVGACLAQRWQLLEMDDEASK